MPVKADSDSESAESKVQLQTRGSFTLSHSPAPPLDKHSFSLTSTWFLHIKLICRVIYREINAGTSSAFWHFRRPRLKYYWSVPYQQMLTERIADVWRDSDHDQPYRGRMTSSTESAQSGTVAVASQMEMCRPHRLMGKTSQFQPKPSPLILLDHPPEALSLNKCFNAYDGCSPHRAVSSRTPSAEWAWEMCR